MAESLSERVNSWARRSVTLKLLTLGVLMVALLIPAAMITSTIREREGLRDRAVGEISAKWGGRQVLAGPVLIVPYRVHFTDSKGAPESRVDQAFFLPERLEARGDVATERRHRGIYEAVLYNTHLTLAGEFARPDFKRWSVAESDVLWNQAVLVVGVPDMKGIRENVAVQWNQKTVPMNPGIEGGRPVRSGMSASVPLAAGRPTFAFSIPLVLNGSGTLGFYPLGKVTEAVLTSKWPAPSFQGNFLPVERQVSSSGFEAKWKVLHFNRNYPQQWRESEVDLQGSDFGVDFITPVDQYQKSMRSTKYAVLFILLTFVALFFIEILNGRSLHPIQYLLVGFAITLFYSLLLSLSEQIPFNAAYALASLGIVAMITGYARAVFGSLRLTAIVGGLVAGLYAYLYVLLQMEDRAFLIGNLGLFAALATVMYLSRRIDWYSPGTRGN
jgi:inner membrane protein